MQIVYIAMGVIFIWLVAITVLLMSFNRFFRVISKGWEKENLLRVIEKLIQDERKNVKNIEELRQLILRINEDGKSHVQKTGLVRFNPFEELGGDHSFSLALLNGRESGIIITGLHTRDRTRVYVKEVKIGKPVLELSREENKALKIAQKIS